MTPQWDKDNWHILEAFKAGKTIQFKHIHEKNWSNSSTGSLSFVSGYDYRIKPEPRKIWITVHPNDVVSGYKSKEMADQCANNTRVDCIEYTYKD